MNNEEARQLLARLRHNNRESFSQRILQALDLAVELLGGPPLRHDSVTAGFVGVVELPHTWRPGRGKGAGMYIPEPHGALTEDWNRVRAFYPLLLEGGAEPDRLTGIIWRLLGPEWRVEELLPGHQLVLSGPYGRLSIPAPERLLTMETDMQGRPLPALHFGVDEHDVLTLLMSHAIPEDVSTSGTLGVIDPDARPVMIDISSLQKPPRGPLPELRSMDDFHRWRLAWGQALFVDVLLETDPRMSPAQAAHRLQRLDGGAEAAWHSWLRGTAGMRRLELAVAGFFANGGASACPVLAVQGVEGAAALSQRVLLEDHFDHADAVDRLCAPGLSTVWQSCIAEYAHHRGGLLPILEAPRFLTTHPGRSIQVSDFRTTMQEGGTLPEPYELRALEGLSDAQTTERRVRELVHLPPPILSRCNRGYGYGHAAFYPWLVVDNPISAGEPDRYVVAPPSGHAAAGWIPDVGISEDLRGAHGPLTLLTAEEQEYLEEEGRIVFLKPTASARSSSPGGPVAEEPWTPPELSALDEESWARADPVDPNEEVWDPPEGFEPVDPNEESWDAPDPVDPNEERWDAPDGLD